MKKTTVALLTLFFLLTTAFSSFAEPVNIYLFHGKTCPHCIDEQAYLDELLTEYPENSVKVNKYEVWYDDGNADLMKKFAESFDFEPSGVPLTFIGGSHWVGFGDVTKERIREAIDNQITSGEFVNTADIVNGVVQSETGEITVADEITLPLIGKVSLKDKSSLFVTFVIGLADGVNPCSLWVLTMLLTIVIHTDSRKKSFIVGYVYIMVTALIYALFILGVFTFLDYTKFIPQIQLIAAAITLVIGIINIKDYFFYKKGVSLTIDDSKKPGIYARMRNIVKKSDSLLAMIGATIVLSAMVSLIEFSCTAAFPVIWSNILASQGVGKPAFYGYLFIYMLLYQFDEIIIFIAAVITMKSQRMEEKHGRFLKLLSGCMMVSLSAVMLINPGVMNNLPNVLLIFAGSILFAFAVQSVYTMVKNKKG